MSDSNCDGNDAEANNSTIYENNKIDNSRTVRLLSYFSAFSAIGVAVSMLAVTVDRNDQFTSKKFPDDTNQRIEEMGKKISILRSDIASLKADQLTSIGRRQVTDKQTYQLSTRFEAIERRQAELERAIMASPEKALAVPLLRRDLDNLKESNIQSIASIKQAIDQVYDLTKWFVGALTVGILSLAISNLLIKDKK